MYAHFKDGNMALNRLMNIEVDSKYKSAIKEGLQEKLYNIRETQNMVTSPTIIIDTSNPFYDCFSTSLQFHTHSFLEILLHLVRLKVLNKPK